MQRALLTGLTILLVVACRGPAATSGEAVPIGLGLPPLESARAHAELEPFAPAFQGIEAALAARDDLLARRILTRVQARGPEGKALERAEAYGRILEGREWVGAIQAWLTAERIGTGDEWLVVAHARHALPSELQLRGAPPTLRTSLLGVSPAGLEQRFVQETQVPALARWRLPPDVETSATVGRFSIPPGNAIAVRAQFVLEFLPGEVVREGVVRPASSIPLARGEGVRLADFLPSEPVGPEELVRYVREEKIRNAPLLERTVRIPLAERARALDLLTPVALELPSGELEKLAVALRWLSGHSDLGADARAWRQWLDERSRARAESREEARRAAEPALELPESPP